MNILIADDHAVMRRGLREILAEALPSPVFVEAASGDQVLALLAHSAPQLVVLNVDLPGRSGLDVLHDVKRLYPRLPVIMTSMQSAAQLALRCLRAGASAYIDNESASAEIALAARKVIGGGRYVGPALAEKLVASIDQPAGTPPHEMLSDREHEVLRMIAAGIPLTEIAARLHVSVKTVSTYRTRILEKMKMKSNAQLIRYAITNDLVE
ncbi:response regulator [Occallatibacter riparius]|uniref:Response regulator transcription factor n=1 Tax=Occallatibacter riparius TaxID=1002689 RepID=A0A9J7BNV5_9BACT|nr:response regulator transcription factor [Occallatibacter riparius]UWZ84564.1 response regulator transcription factor [Occallatibacter riparius]